MNPESYSKDLSPVQDRLTDALLSEHARLGIKRDEDLITNILLNTVHAPVEINKFQPAPRPVFGLADWAKMAAAVAVIGGLGAYGLQQMGSGTVAKTEGRQEETYHLVVDYVEVPQDGEVKSRVERKVLVSAYPRPKSFDPIIDNRTSPLSPFDMTISNDLTPPQSEYGRSIETFPTKAEVSSSFKLASNDTTAVGGKLIYSGEVLLSHPEFTLTADSLVIDRSAGEVPILKALNAKLAHTKGAFETEADAISFDPSSGKLSANGVTRLFSRGLELPVENQTATIVFEGESFFIHEG